MAGGLFSIFKKNSGSLAGGKSDAFPKDIGFFKNNKVVLFSIKNNWNYEKLIKTKSSNM